jgi:hypothetical protein
MGYVIMWVDRPNFKKFMNGKEFTGWNDQSTLDIIQISVPTTAIITLEETEDGICFNCYKKDLWN